MIDSVIITKPIIKSVAADYPKLFYIKPVSKQNIPEKRVADDFDDYDDSIDKTPIFIDKKNFTDSIENNNILGKS